MDMGVVIAVMLVEKGGKAFSLSPCIEEKPSTCTPRRECGSPAFYTCDLSHTGTECAIDLSQRHSICGASTKEAILNFDILGCVAHRDDRGARYGKLSLPPSVTRVALIKF
jgi:hypothetical protein